MEKKMLLKMKMKSKENLIGMEVETSFKTQVFLQMKPKDTQL
jgi:hypothetical protein